MPPVNTISELLLVLGDAEDEAAPIYNKNTLASVVFDVVKGTYSVWTGRPQGREQQAQFVAEFSQAGGSKRRPRTLIDSGKDRTAIAVFSGLGSDTHEDLLPEILRYRPGGWKDQEVQSTY